MRQPNILITICGRGGSKGIPGKNIRPIAGKPLLQYTAEQAMKFASATSADIVLSTDSEEILAVGRQCGLDTDYRRAAHLANDTCGKPDAIKDALLYAEHRYDKRYDYVVDLDITSPIRTFDDIMECVALMERNPEALTVFSVNPAARNPYFNMVQQNADGYYSVVLGGMYTTRQLAPKVYDMNASIYVYRPEALQGEHPRAVTERSLVYVMDHICFDLDEPADFDYLTYLVETNRISL